MAMATRSFSRTQISLHWIVALLVAAQYLFKNAIVDAWNAYTHGQSFAFDPLIMAHVVGEILIMALVLWRIVLRIKRGAPQPSEGENAALKFAATMAHYSLYVVLIGMSVSGALVWFADIQQADQVHNLLKGALLALIALHVLAVLFHHFVHKTPVLGRMLWSSE
jgi:cytochrome b561